MCVTGHHLAYFCGCIRTQLRIIDSFVTTFDSRSNTSPNQTILKELWFKEHKSVVEYSVHTLLYIACFVLTLVN